MDAADFDYDLPADRIAQTPIDPRHAARLLVAHPRADRTVADLADELAPGDLLVVNDTRVIPARLHLRRATGAAVEILLLEDLGDRCWEALARPSRRLRVGEWLSRAEPAMAGQPVQVELTEARGEGRWVVRFGGDAPVARLLEQAGEVPLPPYISTKLANPERYQTTYAARPGSVAAPTAGLHFSEHVFASLAARGVEVARVELTVGLGTFRPISAARVEDHVMHAERYRITPEVAARIEAAPRVVAVGTTVVRTLESWARTGLADASTDLFIHGRFDFRVVDRLLTNFHVPRSSLLVLIDAFLGGDGQRWRELYGEALAQGYRFLSFGDAMLIDRAHRR